MLIQIACGDRPLSLFNLLSKTDSKSHAAVVAVIQIDYQNPLPVAADVLSVSVVVSRRCHIFYIGGGGGEVTSLSLYRCSRLVI